MTETLYARNDDRHRDHRPHPCDGTGSGECHHGDVGADNVKG